MELSKSTVMKIILASVAIIAGLVMPAASQEGQKADPWADYQFLIGQWVNENLSEQGAGSSEFNMELQGKIMVRKNHAETPATEDRPATVHDDLMIMYLSGDGQLKANYYDNEGHVIDYTATLSQDKNTLSFVSTASPETPQFRLSYVKSEAGKLAGSFEIAPPGKAGSFSPYLKWTLIRK